MKHICLILLCALAAGCATAKAGFGLLQTAGAQNRVWLDLDGDFVWNTDGVQWAYVKGTGSYSVGAVLHDPLSGMAHPAKVLKGTGSVEAGWRLVWDDATKRPKLTAVGFDAAHAVLGDPPKVP